MKQMVFLLHAINRSALLKVFKCSRKRKNRLKVFNFNFIEFLCLKFNMRKFLFLGFGVAVIIFAIIVAVVAYRRYKKKKKKKLAKQSKATTHEYSNSSANPQHAPYEQGYAGDAVPVRVEYLFYDYFYFFKQKYLKFVVILIKERRVIKKCYNLIKLNFLFIIIKKYNI